MLQSNDRNTEAAELNHGASHVQDNKMYHMGNLAKQLLSVLNE